MELQAALPALEAAGVWPVALSYDSQPALAAFAAERGITFPLLADAGSVVIRQLGLFNPTFAADHPRYGVAQPGTFLLDLDGRVTRAIVHESQTVRDAWPTAVHGVVDLGAAAGPVAQHTAEGIRLTLALDSASYAPRQRLGLRVRVQIAPGAHVYGRPLPDAYTPLTLSITAPPGVTVEPVAYPPPTPLPLPALGETLPVYTGQVELTTYLTLQEVRDDLELQATVRWQVCTDTDCLLPGAVTMTLPVRQRVPA